MTKFAGRTQRTEAKRSVNHDAAANAGTDSEKDHRIQTSAAAIGELPQCRHARIVEQKHRAAERGG
jgi:hypothetical protein